MIGPFRSPAARAEIHARYAEVLKHWPVANIHLRVPTSQGYELYNALKRQGVTTKMVVYPRTPHGPREPKFILDIAQRHLDWVDKYVR